MKNYFSTYFFRTKISQSIKYIEAQNLEYTHMGFIWREPCLRFLIYVLVFIL